MLNESSQRSWFWIVMEMMMLRRYGKYEKGPIKAMDEICGWTNNRPKHQETWWWNGDVKAKVDEARSKYQIWYKAKDSL